MYNFELGTFYKDSRKMDRSRSNKRSYYYDHQSHMDYDSEPFSRTKPRYSGPDNPHQFYTSNTRHHRGSGGFNSRGGGSGGRTGGKAADPSGTVTTTYRILCHDAKVGGVIGKSGSIIKAIRQHTGAWINVHELDSDDEERIIEISDTRRRDPDGRMPPFSPAQEALSLIHERILESEPIGGGYNQYREEEIDYGGVRGLGGGNRVVTRLVVSKMHVGSLLGKGGKIIEQMRMETKTQMRILPRDNNLPRCVSMGEEIVQIVGDPNAVKKAISIISSRLRESQHRDRSHLQGKFHSDDRYFEDDFIAQSNISRRSSFDGDSFSPRTSSGSPRNRNNNYGSHSSGRFYESEAPYVADQSQTSEDLVFRILCPVYRLDSVVGESNGIIDLLLNEIGVDIKVSDAVSGSDEQIITVLSDEGPDDELFPAQEALLHIQTRIVDLVPDKENIVTTRLLVPASDIGCLRNDSKSLSELAKITGADIEILPREKTPKFVSTEFELVQIVGEIKNARDAIIEMTARLRNFLYKDFFQRDMQTLPDSAQVNFSPEREFSGNPKEAQEGSRSDSSALKSEYLQPVPVGKLPKEFSMINDDRLRQPQNDQVDTATATPTATVPTPSSNRFQLSMVKRSTLEVVIPENAASKLLAKQRNKLAQISELSGANVTLEENPEASEKVIRIAGTPEQSERAQSLLQGFLLSIQEDGP